MSEPEPGGSQPRPPSNSDKVRLTDSQIPTTINPEGAEILRCRYSVKHNYEDRWYCTWPGSRQYYQYLTYVTTKIAMGEFYSSCFCKRLPILTGSNPNGYRNQNHAFVFSIYNIICMDFEFCQSEILKNPLQELLANSWCQTRSRTIHIDAKCADCGRLARTSSLMPSNADIDKITLSHVGSSTEHYRAPDGNIIYTSPSDLKFRQDLLEELGQVCLLSQVGRVRANQSNDGNSCFPSIYEYTERGVVCMANLTNGEAENCGLSGNENSGFFISDFPWVFSNVRDCAGGQNYSQAVVKEMKGPINYPAHNVEIAGMMAPNMDRMIDLSGWEDNLNQSTILANMAHKVPAIYLWKVCHLQHSSLLMYEPIGRSHVHDTIMNECEGHLSITINLNDSLPQILVAKLLYQQRGEDMYRQLRPHLHHFYRYSITFCQPGQTDNSGIVKCGNPYLSHLVFLSNPEVNNGRRRLQADLSYLESTIFNSELSRGSRSVQKSFVTPPRSIQRASAKHDVVIYTSFDEYKFENCDSGLSLFRNFSNERTRRAVLDDFTIFNFVFVLAPRTEATRFGEACSSFKKLEHSPTNTQEPLPPSFSDTAAWGGW